MDKKIHYKIELIYVKYSPMIISLGLLLNNILAYYDIYIQTEGGYVYGVSLLSVGYLYNSSKTYKFCKYHRMFIHYIVVNNCTSFIDYYFNLPINDKELLSLNLVIAGIFLFFILYYHRIYGDRKI